LAEGCIFSAIGINVGYEFVDGISEAAVGLKLGAYDGCTMDGCDDGAIDGSCVGALEGDDDCCLEGLEVV
jgi:hypothetical protein